MRKVFGVTAVLATIATVAFTASMAMAVPATTLLHNPQAQFELNCDTTPGTIWHFVHVKPGAATGTIHVITTSGSIEWGNTSMPSTTMHYNVPYPGGTLLGGASGTHDNVPSGGTGSKLNLSSCPPAPPPPPPPPP